MVAMRVFVDGLGRLAGEFAADVAGLAVLLRAVEIIVGRGEHEAEVVFVFGDAIDEAGGDGDPSVIVVPSRRGDEVLGGGEVFEEVGGGDVAHRDEEFVPAIAVAVVHAEATREGAGDFTQKMVAQGVSLGVVDGLEVVDVDHRDKNLLADEGREGGAIGEAIVDAGEGIGEGCVLKDVVLLVQGGVVFLELMGRAIVTAVELGDEDQRDQGADGGDDELLDADVGEGGERLIREDVPRIDEHVDRGEDARPITEDRGKDRESGDEDHVRVDDAEEMDDQGEGDHRRGGEKIAEARFREVGAKPRQ